MEFTSIDGVSVRPDGVALLTSPFSPPGAKPGAKSEGGAGGEVRVMCHSVESAPHGRSRAVGHVGPNVPIRKCCEGSVKYRSQPTAEADVLRENMRLAWLPSRRQELDHADHTDHADIEGLGEVYENVVFSAIACLGILTSTWYS